MKPVETDFRCGYVAIVGRPNVGKSTLLNRLVGQKISITSRKPQTTRHQILGIKTTSKYQVVYVDTPGLHSNAKRAMNRYMNRAATNVLHGVNIVVFLIEALRWTEDDELVLSRIKDSGIPVMLLVNKIDKLEDKTRLLPFLQELAGKHTFEHILPVSALKGKSLEEFEQLIQGYLDPSEAWYAEDMVTDRSIRFLTAEIIREKLMRTLGQEIPYDLTVEIEQFTEKENSTHIGALIWVERNNQKSIVIGKNGERLKLIGKQSRKDIEHLLDKKVFLELWVKVKEGWSDDERALLSLGYKDELE